MSDDNAAAPSPSSAGTSDLAGYPTRWKALGALLAALSVVVMDTAILSVIVRVIQVDLNASQSDIAWVVNAYSLTFAAFLLTWGVLGDNFGRKKMILLGVGLFGVASILAALSGTAGLLIISRALMGIGAASILPISLAIITVIFTPQERGKAIGLWAATTGGSVALGPVIGGILTQTIGWPAVFLLNVPICAGAIWGILKFVPETRNPNAKALDPTVVILSVAGLLSLVFGIQESDWDNVLTYVWIILGVVLLVLLLVKEARSDDPSIDISLFKIPSFSISMAANALVFGTLLGSSIFLAFYIQIVRGWEPIVAAGLLLPFAAGQLIGAPRTAGLVAKYGARPIMAIGFVLGTLGVGGFSFANETTAIFLIGLYYFLFGAGMGIIVASANTRMALALPPARSGSGSGLANTVRQVVATLAVAISTATVAAMYGSRMTDALSAASTQLPADLHDVAVDSIGGAFGVADELYDAGQITSDQHAVLQQGAIDSFLPAYQVSAWIGCALLLIGLVLVLAKLPANASAVHWHDDGPAGAGEIGDHDARIADSEDFEVIEDDVHLRHLDDVGGEHLLNKPWPQNVRG